MHRPFLTGLTALVVSAAAVVSAQAPQTKTEPAPKIAAQWLLNRELSADPRETTSSIPPPGGPVSSGTMPTGGVGRAGGGGYGGYGGFGGGPTPEKTLRERAIVREASQLPQVLNIVVSGVTVTMTTEDGVTRKFNATGKKEKVNFTTADVDTITQWDKGTLVQEMWQGDLKLKRSWQPNEQGTQLTVTLTTERGKRYTPQTFKLVYDKANK